MSNSAISIQVLSPAYFKDSFLGSISIDDPSKHVNNLQIYALGNKVNIKWTDCSDPNWKSNILIKAKNYIPLSPYDEKIIETTYAKNAYATTPFIDTDIEPNTLYCYRIFTEFKNDDEFYSGLRNIIFIYASEDAPDTDLIDADRIIQKVTKQFVNDVQINNWDTVSTEIIEARGTNDKLSTRLNIIEQNISSIDGGIF